MQVQQREGFWEETRKIERETHEGGFVKKAGKDGREERAKGGSAEAPRRDESLSGEPTLIRWEKGKYWKW